jgi:hypothetical protein
MKKKQNAVSVTFFQNFGFSKYLIILKKQEHIKALESSAA